jgi:hypothetical protein
MESEDFWRAGDLIVIVQERGFLPSNLGKVDEVIRQRDGWRITFFGREPLHLSLLSKEKYQERLVVRVEDTESDDVFELRIKELALYKSIMDLYEFGRQSPSHVRLMREHVCMLHAVQQRMIDKGARVSFDVTSKGGFDIK